MAPFGTLYTIDTNKFIHPRSRPVFATASLAGIELSQHEGFNFGTTNKTPEYLARFPLGKIPSFEGTDGFLLTESNAIAFYLADSAPDPAMREQLLGADVKQRALVLQWISFTVSHLVPVVADLGGWRLGFGTFNAEKEKASAADMNKWLDYMESHLKGRKWLISESGGEAARGPSLADLIAASQMYFGYLTYIDAPMREKYPEVLRWYESLAAVPELNKLYDTAGKMVEKRKEGEEKAN